MALRGWLRFGFSDMVAVVFIAIGVAVTVVSIIEPSFEWLYRVMAFVTGVSAVKVGIERIRDLPEPPGMAVADAAVEELLDDGEDDGLPLSPEQPHDRSKDTNRIETDGFSNPESERLLRERWPDEPATARQWHEGLQCLDCASFAELNLHFGICSNPASRYQHETVFEHFTCPAIAFERKH